MNHPYTSYTSTEDSTLTFGTLLDTMRKLSPVSPRIVDVIYEEHCVTDDEVKRSWKERVFSWPWRPWRKTKIVQNPAMYFVDYIQPMDYITKGWWYRSGFRTSINKILVAHPSFKEEIDKMLEER